MSRSRRSQGRFRTPGSEKTSDRALPPVDDSRDVSAPHIWWRHVAWWLVWVVFSAPICFRQLTSSDSWWHIHWGRWWVQHWQRPDLAQFYFTPVRQAGADFRSTVLGDIALYFAHAAAGDVGLQVLSFGALLVTGWLLHSLTRRPLDGWGVIALMALTVGTYQLQIPRNAIISLPFLALTFRWLDQWSRQRNRRSLWFLCLVLVFWSGFHGSALFGWLVCALFLVGDAINCHRRSPVGEQRGREFKHTAAMLAVSFLCICAGNDATTQVVHLPFLWFTEVRASKSTPAEVPAAKVSGTGASESVPPQSSGVAGWLNRTLWRSGPGGVRSVEFDSPFVRLGTALVPVSLALLVIAWAAACFTRPVRWDWLGPLALTSLMALSYLRFVGYGAIAAVAFLFGAASLQPYWTRVWRENVVVGNTCALLALGMTFTISLSGGLGKFLGVPDHVPGVGKSAAFSDHVYDWVLKSHPDRRVFTTIATGSYALYRWQGRLPVFIDGFFGAHPSSVWADYRRVREDANLDILTTRYGAEIAIIENSRPDWTALFLGTQQWRPVAVSSGCLVMARTALVPWGTPPALLVDEAAAARLPVLEQRTLAVVYGGTMLALAAHRDFEAAAAFEKRNPKLSAFLHTKVNNAMR